MGLGGEISSIRPVEGRYGDNDNRRYGDNDDRRYAAQGYDYRRRPDERLFEAQVTSVRAVVGPPEQRCWVERQEYGGNANIPGAIAGRLSAAFWVTRSAADAARTSRRRAAPWRARRSAAMSAVTAGTAGTFSTVPTSQ